MAYRRQNFKSGQVLTAENMKRIDEGISEALDEIVRTKEAFGNIRGEEVTKAVENYLNENPPVAGATAEQVAKIQNNADKIDELKDDLVNVSNVVNGEFKTSINTNNFLSTDGKLFDVMSDANVTETEEKYNGVCPIWHVANTGTKRVRFEGNVTSIGNVSVAFKIKLKSTPQVDSLRVRLYYNGISSYKDVFSNVEQNTEWQQIKVDMGVSAPINSCILFLSASAFSTSEDVDFYITEPIVYLTDGFNMDIAVITKVSDGLVESKVDKVKGKGLSTNDYTNEDKAKVDNIGSQRFAMRFAKAIFIGDSLTYGYAGTNARLERPYPENLDAKMPFKATRNYGITGTCITNADGLNGSQKAMSDDTRIATWDTDADIVSVFGGYNDWKKSASLGTIDSTDVSNFYGAYNHLIMRLLEIYPKARIMLIVPCPITEGGVINPTGTMNEIGLSIKDYADAVIALADKYEIDYFNLYEKHGLTSENFSTYMAYSHFNQKYIDEILAPMLIDFISKDLANY